ncbi:ATP-binding cassette domain-containing protein [Streptomyces actinomycinicus]|uniref:ATP-binding cassette domain-containing protein n=1 Tax=Streptomyces actinomycinicus TaxID=1695166 RepID=UPI0027D9EE55|nr:ATP-binding cassette domain-containing protein [Streptomyces actinomycinicus]
MIQAFGLTSNSRKAHPPAVDDISFEARAGHVTALLGGAGAGKTTVLKLMLELQQGRGITYFRGRPLHRIAHPFREVGVLLGDVPGHPARTVRGHLRMLCAAAGVPARRADEVLEVVGLVSLREERLGTLSRGMDRRLGLACALLPDPHTLVLDEPTDGLSVREAQWLHGMLRAHATQGGTVLLTTADPKEAARTADRVVTLDGGRLVADQEGREFARTRLRPRVAVRSPHAARLAALLAKDARTARRSVEVVREGGNRLSVYGSTTADVGEIAFRNGILVHQLADEVGDMGPGADTGSDEGTPAARTRQPAPEAPPTEESGVAQAQAQPEREQGGTDRARVRNGATGPGFSALPSATAARGSAPQDPGPAGSEPPAAPERAVWPDVTDPGMPVGASGTGETVREPETAAVDQAAAEPRASAPDRPGPEQATPVPGPSPENRGTAAGDRPSGHREHTAAEPSAPEGEGPAGHPPAEDGPRSAGVPLPTWARATDQDRSGLAEPLGRPSLRDLTEPPSGTPAPGTSPAAASPSDGAAHATAAAEGKGGTGDAPGEVPERAAGPTAPDHSPGGSTTASGPRTGGTRTLAAGVTATRTRLPGARNPDSGQSQAGRAARTDGSRAAAALSPLPPPISVRPARSPLRPLRYEIRRATGIGTGFLTCGAVLVVSALAAVLLARIGHTPQARLFAAWPRELPLPPAALAAGLLGALAFGDEFRHPALAADRGTVPRRLGLLTAKLLVSGATAVMLAFLTVGCDAEVLYIVYGRELTQVPADWLPLIASWFGLVVGCAWAGVLAAGVFRSTTAGLAAVLAVPVLVVPVVHRALQGPAVRMAADLPGRVREVFLIQWPFGGDRYLLAVVRILAQPVGGAMALSLTALLCAYLLTTLRTRFR